METKVVFSKCKGGQFLDNFLSFVNCSNGVVTHFEVYFHEGCVSQNNALV